MKLLHRDVAAVLQGDFLFLSIHKEESFHAARYVRVPQSTGLMTVSYSTIYNMTSVYDRMNYEVQSLS